MTQQICTELWTSSTYSPVLSTIEGGERSREICTKSVILTSVIQNELFVFVRLHGSTSNLDGSDFLLRGLVEFKQTNFSRESEPPRNSQPSRIAWRPPSKPAYLFYFTTPGDDRMKKWFPVSTFEATKRLQRL